MNEINKNIESHLKYLKLSGIMPVYEELSLKATKSKLLYEEYLLLLLEEEIKRKQDASVKSKIISAKFPFVKTIEEFDFSFQPDFKEKEIIRLSGLGFIENKENVIFLGPPGVGKTHLAIGLGIKACIQKHRVIFISAAKLLEDLLISSKNGTLVNKLLMYSRFNLLIIDELGYMPIVKEQANLLFQLISMRYEKGSIILTSNYNFDDWSKVFDDNIVASAIIDRLVHHSSLFYINGSSYRIKDKIRKKS
jgi:DNA replication protein DnaC